jgi:hypothetical protein
VMAGAVRAGPYSVWDAVRDYLSEIAAEKEPTAVQGARYVFDAWILPELGATCRSKSSSSLRLNWSKT